VTTSARTLTPEQQAALQKLQSFQQQRALDQYLSERATQYGTTPKGAKADTGWTAGESLVNPFVGMTKDFGTYERPRMEYIGQGEEGGYEQKIDTVNRTAGDVLSEQFKDQLGHKSVFLKGYKKDEKGNPVEVDLNSLTPEQINSGDYIIYMGGKTGGTERERMAQAYIPKGDKLIPVGDPSYYKGEHPDAQNVANALKIASIASLPFGGIGGLLGNVGGQLGSFLGGSALANVGANALVSGVLQGGLGTLTGQSFGKGFRSGAGSSLIGSGVDTLGNMTGLNQSLGQLAAPVKSIATSGIASLASGRPFDLEQAVKGAAINTALNQVIGEGGKTLGIDPKQQAALMKFYKFAAPMIAAQKRKP
jgi:hypothetical protein